jgi:integrator complex subunit 9
MKIRTLGTTPQALCSVVELHDSAVMLDCALEQSQLVRFAPEWNASSSSSSAGASSMVLVQRGNEVFIRSEPRFHVPEFDSAARVDAVLVTHARNALALPYLIERGFKGAVYATQPVIEALRQLLSELVDGVAALTQADYAAGAWQRTSLLANLPAALLAQLPDVLRWRALFGAAAVDALPALIVPVAFHQSVAIAANVIAVPVASGHSLGAANWILHSPSLREKVVYVADACSPALARYPLPLDIDALRNADALILAGLGRATSAAAAAAAAAAATSQSTAGAASQPRFLAFVDAVDRVVRGGGCVLVPSFASGIAIDLIMCLDQHFRTMKLNVPMVLLGSAAQHAVAYADVAAEWVCEAMQARAYASSPPFAFDDLVQRRALVVSATLEAADRAVGGALLRYRGTHFDNIEAASVKDGLDTTSCVVFAGDPSLRFGDALRIMQLWRDEPRNAVVVCESEHDIDSLLAPFQPMSLQAFNCAADVDPRLSLAEARRLLADIKPRRLVAPTAIVDRLGYDCIGGPILSLARGNIVALPIEQSVERAYVDGALAASLTTTAIDASTAAELLAGQTDLLSGAAGTTQSVLFAPFTARASGTDLSALLLKGVVGGGTVATAVTDTGDNNVDNKRTDSHASSIGSHQPDASAVIDAIRQRCGDVSVRVEAAPNTTTTTTTTTTTRKRLHSERIEIGVGALDATVTLDAERGETTVRCNGAASARAVLVDAVRVASSMQRDGES